jgi:Penicillin V acylase and related amidases
MKKILKRIGIGLLAVLIVVLITSVALFWNELRSLTSLKKVDNYGMYKMTYYGDYGFDEFLKTGAKDDSDIEKFVTKRLLKGLPIDLGVTGDACTSFVTHNEKGDIIFGRNFDFDYAPSLQLYTHPAKGYASVSTVNLAYAGYSKDYLPKGLSFDSFLTLAAPFLPFDGMNEKGVAMALLAVPEVQLKNDENKVTLNTTTAIRLVLDKAATVDEAVALLKQYNIYFSGDVDCHFLIADASGRSVIVEYYDGGVQVVESDADYQIASNFIAYKGLNIGEGFNEFERYDKVKAAIDDNGGKLTEDQALALLAQIGIIYKNTDRLQWSVVYNLTSGEEKLFAHRNIKNILDFHLDLKK